jgi:hypothetical protein
MAPPTATELFLQLPEYSVIVCRQCQYAVRPTQVVFHLTHSPHRTTAVYARQVQAAIEEWDGVEVDINHLTFPARVDQPIDGLTMYTDGILCTRVPGCGYVCRSKESLRKHWRTEHGWSPYGLQQGDQQSHHHNNTAQAAIQDASQAVCCQRFFTTKFGSHYMHVRRPGSSYEPVPPPAHPTVVQGLVSQLERCFVESQASDSTVIQAGELDEANPWLRRTQWAQYLQGIPVRPLAEAIATPDPDAEGPDAVVRAI